MNIDTFQPSVVIRPTSVEECGDAIRKASAIYPHGGGTKQTVGLTPVQSGVAVDLRSLNRVIDYPARDMTITVEAGITLAELAKILHTEGQQLPTDAPLPDQATLGGLIATNTSGSRRFGYGTIRDYLIGITVMDDEGKPIKGGGRVVKNVAGYDFMKLHSGAFGTLGPIVQATLKVKPLPQATAMMLVPVKNTADLKTVTDIARFGKTRPMAVDVVNPAMSKTVGTPEGKWSAAIIFEDNAEAVAWQRQTLRSELPTTFDIIESNESDAKTLLKALTDHQLGVNRSLGFKATLLPEKIWAFLELASLAGLELHAHVGNGIVRGWWIETPKEAPTAKIQELLSACGTDGNLTLPICPSEWKRLLPVWGRSTADRAIMRKIKDALDPKRIFNPGRFVDGI